MLLPVVDWKEFLNKRGMKVVLTGLAVLVGMGGIGVAAYKLWPEPGPKPPPPVASSTMEQSTAYAASEDFKRLPMEKRLAWVEGQAEKLAQMDDEEFARTWMSLDLETRNKVRDNMREVLRKRAERQADDYFRLPPAERKAFLDKQIEEMNQWESKFRKTFGRSRRGPGSQPAVRTGEPGPRSRTQEEREAMRQRFFADAHRFMANESADKRGKMLTYFSQLARRRAERGEGDFFGRRPVVKKTE